MAKIALLVGTRPNIVKITLFRKLVEANSDHELTIIHSNQHFTDSVSGSFLGQFDITIDRYLPVFHGTPSAHIGHIIFELSGVLEELKPDLLIVVGDVNTTLAGGIVANKMSIRLAHLESGLRSFDRGMPEEINRLLVDEISDYYFVTEKSGLDNLLKEGRSKDCIYFVGNTMIDTLVAFRGDIQQSRLPFDLPDDLKTVTLTMHRPSNVDTEEGLLKIISLLEACANEYRVVFPVHPRTKNNFARFGLEQRSEAVPNLILTEPLDYFSFQKLISLSYAVITDSGGIQEETTFLKIPCITLRKNTERPVTVAEGTNVLMDFDIPQILSRLESQGTATSSVPELWDGKTTERIVEILNTLLK